MLMQPQIEDLIFSNITGESIPFNIGDSSVIIDIIRKRIYSYPIRTMVGEYLSNGRDACFEAGKECRIDVTLPTLLQPEFIVRDYGTGMSDERIREVFVRYGISTKRGSKSQLGYFGIGAKSGWAYSDSFIVESYYEKNHREYIADIGENKEGRLLLFKESPTEEENGVRIRIPVNPEDVNRFISAYKRATFLWEKHPSSSIDRLTYPDVYLDLGSVRLFKTAYDISCSLVLDANGMPFDISDEDLLSICKNEKIVIAIKADPAKLNISANREGFSNSEYASKLISKAKTTLSNYVDKEFEKVPFSEHRKVYSEMSFLRGFRYPFSNKPYSFNTNSFTLNHNQKSYFFVIQHRKPIEKCIIKEYPFKTVDNIFLCRSNSLETLTPETKKALRVAKSEHVASDIYHMHKSLLFFKSSTLTDNEYKEIAEIIGATSYLEDVYAGKIPTKVVTVATVKQPKVLCVKSFVKRNYRSKVTKGPLTTLANYGPRSVIFYGEECSSTLFDFLLHLEILHHAIIYVTSDQVPKIVELNDSRFVPISNWKSFFQSNPNLLDTLGNAFAIIKYPNIVKLLKVFGAKLCLPFDILKINEKVATIEKQGIRIDHQFYKTEFTQIKTEIEEIAEKYPLLTNIENPTYCRDRNSYLDHINIYLQGVNQNA